MAVKDNKLFWIKLKRDFFKRHDIMIVEEMPNGKDYVLFYLKLLCESVDHDGNLRFSDEIPYNEQMLSTITHTNIDIVRSAIKVFSQLHMMEIMDDGTYFMNQVKAMAGSETYWAQKKREQRELLSEKSSVGHFPTLSNASPTCPSKSIEIEIDKEKDIKTMSQAPDKSGALSESPVLRDGVIADQGNDERIVSLSESPVSDDGVITDQGEKTGKKRESTRKTQAEANDLFEKLWKLYPNKRGKGKISDAKKRALLEVGQERMERAIKRYTDEHDAKERSGRFTPNWQHGSTFFTSGYLDYLDENYVSSPISDQSHIKPCGFSNFEQSGTDWNAAWEQIVEAQMSKQ